MTLPKASQKSVFGASVGILMLETHFPRIPGDIGNALTWPFPVHYQIVTGATAQRVVVDNDTTLLTPFVDAARTLVSLGVDGITTSCGFLAPMQKELAAAVGVPVIASSLSQIPWINSMLPPARRVGVLTINSATLNSDHLIAAGAPPDTPVVGTETGREFTRAILNNETSLDIELCREDNIQAALTLVQQYPDVGAIVLECTNMVPYAAAIQQATGRPVYSIYSLICWFQAGLTPRAFNER